MAEWSKAPDSRFNPSFLIRRHEISGPLMRAGVQIPFLTNSFFRFPHTEISGHNFFVCGFWQTLFFGSHAEISDIMLLICFYKRTKQKQKIIWFDSLFWIHSETFVPTFLFWEFFFVFRRDASAVGRRVRSGIHPGACTSLFYILAIISIVDS
jgi:hypothetical protein